ncbi:MAG: hypothetical protein HOF23_09790 [Rhodospirillaceae bacterium]|nr:hypothetical protein [Rhodospirillaceae bacterium]
MRNKMISKKLFLGILLGLISLSIFSLDSLAYVQIQKLTKKISEDDHQKYKFLYQDLNPAVAKDDIYFFGAEKVNVIRLQNKNYCNKVWCVTFVILKCGKTNCPYASAVAGRKFFFSDHLKSDFGYPVVPMSFFDMHEGLEGSVSFLIDHDFISVQGHFKHSNKSDK